MTVTISSPSNGNRTLTYIKTAPSAKMLEVGERVVRWMWNTTYRKDDLRTYDELTNTERMEILDKIISDFLRDIAEASKRGEYDSAYQKGDFEMGILPK